MANLIKIQTPKCPMCNQSITLEVSEKAYDDFVNGGLVQRCFPELSPEIRERLITGICPECWNKIFK